MNNHHLWHELWKLPAEHGWAITSDTLFWRKGDYVLHMNYIKDRFEVFKPISLEHPFVGQTEDTCSFIDDLPALRRWFVALDYLFLTRRKNQDSFALELPEDSE